jgi:hypothetical protein
MPELRVIRSLAAEAKLNIALERGHQVTVTYGAEMRKQIREKLLSEAKNQQVGRLATVALRALDAKDEGALSRVIAQASEQLDP